LSSFFYINPTTVQPKGAYWNALHLDDDRIWKPNFKPWLPLVKKYPQSFEVYIDKESFFTIHHERFGLLYPDTLLTGSANFVFPFSVNTLEVVRIPSVFKAVEAEVSTFRDEPYFVTSGGQHLSHIGRFEKGCLFFFERAVPHGDEYEPKQYSGTELLGELQRTGFAQSLSEVKLIEPTKESWGPTIADHKFEARTVGEQFQAFSSYVCISNESSGRSVVVRLTPQRSSGAQE
jgi:hypothetical protein